MTSIDNAIQVAARHLQPLVAAFDAHVLAEAILSDVIAEGDLVPADELQRVGHRTPSGALHASIRAAREVVGCEPVYRRVTS